MALLILFGFIAGAATALSPCVLPVLPIALSAGATGGRRRPLGIVAGLAVSFTFATVALVYVISALGLPNDFLRKLAIVVLLGFGIVLMIPPLAARLEAWIAGSRAGPASPSGRGDGFWSGTAVGASLGLVYAPCAGPILAGVITVSASQSFSTGRLAVALSYGIGSAVVLYFLMLGGRKVVAAAGAAWRRPADRDGRGDGRRRPGDAAATTTSASRTRSPATCRASSSTRAKAWRTPPRHSRRWQTSAATAAHGVGARAASAPQPEAARRRRAPDCRCSAWRRNSSATSSGSTPPATGR